MTAPKNTKKPQDHKPKGATAAEEVRGEAKRTVEFHGYEYTVDWDATDDIEVFEALANISTQDNLGNIASLLISLKALLGDEFDRWKKEQKAVHGKVGAEVMSEFVEAATPGN